jgi:hypothetical protein
MHRAPLTTRVASARSDSCATPPRGKGVDSSATLGQARARLIELLPILEDLIRTPTVAAVDQACAAVSAAAAALARAGVGPTPVHDLERAQAPTLVRSGRHWQIRLADRTALVGHSVGMLHLAVLLANPRTEIAAAELAVGAAAFSRRSHPDRRVSQPLLDRTAIQQYRRRLAQLDADEPAVAGGPQRASPARAERDWIIAELAAATGLGGRGRDFPDNAERARIAVSKAVRRAIDRIDAADPHIGGHLRGAIYTGARCAYWPPTN